MNKRTLAMLTVVVGSLAVALTGTFAVAAPPRSRALKKRPVATQKKPKKLEVKPPAAYTKLKATQGPISMAGIPDFTFRVPVDIKKIHRDTEDQVFVECIVWEDDWATVQSDWAKHALEPDYNDPESSQAYTNYWMNRVAEAKAKVPINAAGAYKGDVTVQVHVRDGVDPVDGKAWTCKLVLRGGCIPRREPCPSAYTCNDLQVAAGTALIFRRGGAL
jgi:hypothetical protein